MPGITICAPVRSPVAEIEDLQAREALATSPDWLSTCHDIHDTCIIAPFSCFPDCPPCQNLDQPECWAEVGLWLPIHLVVRDVAVWS